MIHINIPYHVIKKTETQDEVVYIVKYIDKRLSDVLNKLKEFHKKQVRICSYSRHLFVYASYEDKNFNVYSQFAADRIKQKNVVLVSPPENTEISNETKSIRGTVGAIEGSTVYLLVGDKIVECVFNTNTLPDLNEEVDAHGSFNGKFIVNFFTKVKRSSQPRVELHVKTNNSEFMSILKPEDAVRFCAKSGYPALAITDYMSVHAYPLFGKLCEQNNVKPIFGAELSVGNKDDKVVVNLAQEAQNLFNAKYAIVDVETTGLNVNKDEMIEISICVLDKFQVVDKFTSFIKPSDGLTKEITQLTGIKDSDLVNAPTKEAIANKVLKMLEGCVIVAHNATFDYSFLQKTFGKINNPVLDTLKMARVLLKSKKRLSLKALASHFKIKQTNAHRAEADVDTLTNIFIKLLRLASKQGIDTFERLNEAYVQIGHYDDFLATAIVQEQTGLTNLYTLLSQAYTVYLQRIPVIPRDKLFEMRKGLLLGTGLPQSELYEALKMNAEPTEIKRIIDDYDYIEVCPIDATEEPEVAKEIFHKECVYAETYKKPIVIVSNAVYLYKNHQHAYKAMLGSKRVRHTTQVNAYLRNADELFKAALEFAVNQEQAKKMVFIYPAKIADMVKAISIVPDQFITPGLKNADEIITKLALKGLEKHYGSNPPELVKKRFDRELQAIVSNKYSELYLTAYLAIQHSLQKGYIVGSRGSVGSSLVAYLIGITEVNPLPAHYICPKCFNVEFVGDIDPELQVTSSGVGYDLPDKYCQCGTKMKRHGFNIPFEMFMGIDNNKIPDIDLNFSDEVQGYVHSKIKEQFGEQNVLRAGTVLRIASRTGFAIANEHVKENKLDEKLIPVIVSQILDVKTGTGQHPGGLLIFNKDSKIENYTPVQYPANNPEAPKISHIEYDYLHDSILKLDALGHQNPSIIKELHDLTKVDPWTVDMSDQNVLKLFSSSEPLNIDLNPATTVGTIGIPEFGTKFVRRILEKIKPKTFEELVKICGLAHGTNVWNNNADFYIRSKQASLMDVIASRDDIFVRLVKTGIDKYTAFEIAERVKKGKGLQPKHLALLQNKIPNWYIESANKIKYLFPKAHAAAYTIMSYRIAWFKIYYPLAFYAALLTKKNVISHEYYLMDIDQLKNEIIKGADPNVYNMAELTCIELIYEAKLRGFEFLPPHVCFSHSEKFTIEDNKIKLPLSAIAGVGVNTAKVIYEERCNNQFVDLNDFMKRTNVNKLVLEKLQQATALQYLG